MAAARLVRVPAGQPRRAAWPAPPLQTHRALELVATLHGVPLVELVRAWAIHAARLELRPQLRPPRKVRR